MNESSDNAQGRDAPFAPFDDVAHLGAEIAAALAVVHEAGHPYGELKPENVVLDADGGARLADRAVAPAADGSGAYRAPELAAGAEPTAAGDLYALGVVLYELVAGTLPTRREPPLRPPSVSGGFWAVIRALLADDPSARPSAQAVADALSGRSTTTTSFTAGAVFSAEPGAATEASAPPTSAPAALGDECLRPTPWTESAPVSEPPAPVVAPLPVAVMKAPALSSPGARALPEEGLPPASSSRPTSAARHLPPVSSTEAVPSTDAPFAWPGDPSPEAGPLTDSTATRSNPAAPPPRTAPPTQAAPLIDWTAADAGAATEPAASEAAAPAFPPPALRPVVPAARTARKRRGRTHAVAAATVLGLVAGAWALMDGEQPAAEQVAARAEAPSGSLGAAVRGAATNGPIAYVRKQDGVWRLFRMNADGSGQAPLTDLGADTSPPVFSPDGTKIAFVGYRRGEEGLHVMNVDGSARIRLHESGRWPAFSPDGRTIAFDGMWHRNDEVHTINVDGSGLTRLTEGGRADAPRTPVFSPDGTRILCTGYVGDDQAVLLMNADGTNRRVLAPNGALPSFAPDGSKVAFTGTKDNEVHVIGADGTGAIRLTHNRARDWFPRFSPDGDRIVFTSNRAGNDPASENFGAYVMNADGSGQTRLLESDLGRSVPAFSPDGTKIAVSALRGDPAEGEFDMYVLNADGTERTALRAEGANPVWGPRPPD